MTSLVVLACHRTCSDTPKPTLKGENSIRLSFALTKSFASSLTHFPFMSLIVVKGVGN